LLPNRLRSVELFYGTPDGGTRFVKIREKGGGGAGRHFAHIDIINSPEIRMTVRHKYGTLYDSTAALNI